MKRSKSPKTKPASSNRGEFRQIGIHIELALQHATVLGRQHLDELGGIFVPMIEDAARDRALRVLMMPHEQRMDLARFGLFSKPAQLDHSHVASRREAAVVLKDVGDSAPPSGGEVAPGLAEHDHK